jgi:hypothetical protein
MANLADDPDFVSVLYYGSYGTGKTTALAHMAHEGIVKYIRPDRGVRVRPLRRHGIPVENIEPIDNFDPISLEKTIEEWRTMLAEDPKAIAGVIIDTATELVGRRIEVYVDHDWRTHVTAMKKAHADINRLDRYIVGDGRDQYKGVTQELRRIVRHVNDLPCHFGIAAQARDEAGKITPDVNPALRGDLIGYVDFVIRLEQEGEWPDGRDLVVGYPKPDERHVAKDRDGILPRRFADPTFSRLLAYTRGELEYQTDPVQLAYKDLLKQRKDEQEHELD